MFPRTRNGSHGLEPIKRLAGYLVLFLGALLFSGCSTAPSDSDLARAISEGDPLVGQVYIFRNLRRLNGYEIGNGRYVVEFSCDLLMVESPAEHLSSLGKQAAETAGLMGGIASFSLAAGAAAKWGVLNSVVLVSKNKGDIVPFTGKIEMLKSERGWIAAPGN